MLMSAAATMPIERNEGSTWAFSLLVCAILRAASALDRPAVDLDACHVRVSAGAVPAAREEVGEADLVDLAQVGVRNPAAHRYHAIDVELQPTHVRDRDVVDIEV